jgi:hypothetical protein
MNRIVDKQLDQILPAELERWQSISYEDNAKNILTVKPFAIPPTLFLAQNDGGPRTSLHARLLHAMPHCLNSEVS